MPECTMFAVHVEGIGEPARRVEIPAFTDPMVPDLAWHPMIGGDGLGEWSLSHIRTGYRVGNAATSKEASEMATSLSEIDWAFDEPEEARLRAADVNRILASLTQPPAQGEGRQSNG